MSRFLNGVALVAALAALAATACGQGRDPGPALAGHRVEVVAVWEGIEADRFRIVLDRFETETGAEVAYTSTEGADLAAVLDARLAGPSAPEVAIVPLPGLIERYARQGELRPLEDLVGADVDQRYPAVWRRLGSVDDELYGVWFKAAHKSLVWYEVAVFEAAGVVPPSDLDDFGAMADTLSATGTPAFSVGAADGWTLTDWFENLYLRIAGPDRYDALSERRLAWTDPSVVDTLALMARLLAPANLAGGAEQALATTFGDSVAQVFQRPPAAAMLVGGDFVAGFIAATSDAELGIDADVFLFPEPDPAVRTVVGAGDAVILLRETPAAAALVQYLATAEAAEVWARLGGFLSPNVEVGLDLYPDDRTRRIARSLLEAGEDFRFDLSDRQPVEFGGTAGAGMLGLLQAFLEDPGDPSATAGALEDAARSATGSEAGPTG
jgi:alpha-glucoside transport system substrate-binding protein